MMGVKLVMKLMPMVVMITDRSNIDNDNGSHIGGDSC